MSSSNLRTTLGILAILSVFLAVIDSTIIRTTNGDWTHHVKLEQENSAQIRWKNTLPDDLGHRWLILEIKVRDTGYVGIGFSPNGAMTGADMAIGWIDSDGTPHLKDFHGLENGLPIEDELQDYELLKLTKEGEYMTLRLKRKWDTCDDQDIPLTNDTMRLIWAHGSRIPEIVDGSFKGVWHGPNSRHAKSVVISDGGAPPHFPDEAPSLYPGVKSWDMTMDNVQVEAINTTYYCKILKFTDTGKKHHMIGWKPILTPENANIVHHIVVYECSVPKEEVSLFDKHTSEKGGLCYTRNMPAEWGRNCVTFMFVWVVGSEGEMFPEQVGSPLGEEHDGATYFMVEMHYENSGLRRTVDSSGIRLFYTDNLRQYDGGVMLVGYRHSPFLMIPPKQDNFVINGVCGSECTERSIPPGGIHLTNTLVHLHLWGRRIRLRHIRNGIELPIIAEDNYYDFNYQQSRTLQHELTILPGDELITECEYNTSKADKYVLGGLATMQEMCQVFFFYYPRVNLTQCTSQYEFNDFFKGFGIDGVKGEVLKSIQMPYDPKLLTPSEAEMDLPDDAKELEGFAEGLSYKSLFDHLNVTGPQGLDGLTAGQWIDEIEWSKANLGKDLETFWKNGNHYSFCTKPGRRRELLDKHIIRYPTISKPLVKTKSDVCRLGVSTGNTARQQYNSLHFAVIVALLIKLIH